MMLSKNSANEKDASGDSYNVQLLRDIKEISSALYLHKAPPKALLSHVRSKSVGKSNAPDSRRNHNSKTANDSSLQKSKKSWLTWNWKKPLRAFMQQRYDICFLLHVHSIEGLPSNLNKNRFIVQWKMKDEVLCTRPSIVLDGTAEFGDTLIHRCAVYGSKSRPHYAAKYEEKLFLIYVYVADAPHLDLGKHWIDLTRLLPLSLEELESERSTRKWTTSFKLSGVACGAIVNLSFDYSVVRDTNSNVSGASNSMNRNTMLRRVGSVQSNLDRRSSLLDDGKVLNQVPNLSLEFSKSIGFLYEKLDEGNSQSSTGEDVQYEHRGKTSLDTGLENANSTNESDDTEFDFIEKGIEMFEQEGSRLEESTVPDTGSSRVETIDVDEILKDDDAALGKETHFTDHLLMAGPENGGTNLSSKQSVFGKSESAFSSQVVSKPFDVEFSSALDDSLEQETFLEVKSSYKATKMSSTKSLSLDDITESVASDFLNMLELEDCSYIYSSACEPSSPHECLWREFEREALDSRNFFLDFDGEAEYASAVYEEYRDFSFSSSTEDVDENNENKRKSKAQPLIHRRKGKVLEDLETESLMREWGLNENIFQNSPRVCSDGFGSPIELSIDEVFELPPLGDHLGPLVRTRGGGYIRSMNPSLFRKSKDATELIMQVSAPVVLASKLGSDVIEILQSMSASGIHGLSSQVNAFMPLEDITGKTIHQVAEDSMSKRVLHDCSDDARAAVDQKTSGQLGSEETLGGYQSNMLLGYVAIQSTVPVAMYRLESLAVEGLRIQCGMSDQDAPSSVEPIIMDPSDASELIGLCLSLDEWLKLDCGTMDDGDQTSEEMIKILLAHHANQDTASSKKHQMLGNKLTLALMVMLRDPFRNYEPVGASMLALIQVERPSDSSNTCAYRMAQDQQSKEAYESDIILWRITEITLAGLKMESGVDHPWATRAQQQSGARWLLARGMGKTVKLPSLNAITVSRPQAARKHWDAIWSITTNSHNQENKSNSCSVSAPFTRNPDVKFPNESTLRS